MAMPPLNRARELYFAGLIFVVCQSTAKTAKIGPLENFPLYGNRIHERWLQANKQVNKCIVEAHSGSPHYVLQDHVHDSVCGYCLSTVITVGILGGGKTLLLQFN